LVVDTSLYYDARSEKHQIILCEVLKIVNCVVWNSKIHWENWRD